MKDAYRLTRRCCSWGAIIQAIALNIAPLFFVVLQDIYAISFEKLGRLVLITFMIQLFVDFAAVYFVDRLGYRACMLLAHIFTAGGLVLFGILPRAFSDAYIGMILAVVIYSIGAGLLEVLISPTVEAIPSDNKATSMTMIHAFYPLGQVFTVLVTTLSIAVFGEGNWWWIFMAWALVPVINLIRSLRAPFPPVLKSEEKTPLISLLKAPRFWLMLLLMICAGASEQTMAQWASLFAEKALGVDKVLGDLLGPCLFAVGMLIGRFWYGKYGDGIPLRPLLMGCSLSSVGCYALAVFAAFPFLALIGCALCGLAVSLMWPGTLSISASRFPMGGTALFALLALGGDLGCSLGPWIAGAVADVSPYGIKAGLIAATVFPLGMFLILSVQRRKKAAEE